MEAIYDTDRAFYDTHILYQFLGISRHADIGWIKSQLAKEQNVKDQFRIRQEIESNDVKAEIQRLEAEIKRLSTALERNTTALESKTTALERKKDFQRFLAVLHDRDIKDLYMNFERAKTLLNKKIRKGYDLNQDRPGDPALPPRPADYYDPFPQPSDLPTFSPPSGDPPINRIPAEFLVPRDPAVRRSAHSSQGHRANHHHRQPPPNPPAPEMTGTILAHHSSRP